MDEWARYPRVRGPMFEYTAGHLCGRIVKCGLCIFGVGCYSVGFVLKTSIAFNNAVFYLIFSL